MQIKRKKERKKERKQNSVSQYVEWLTAFVFLSFGIFSLYYYQNFSINFQDDPYQIMNGVDVLSSPASILSSFFINVFGSHFDFGLLPIRRLMSSVTLLSAISASCFYFWKKRNLARAIAVLGITCVIGSYYITLGWDTFSDFFLLLLLISFLGINESEKKHLWFIVAGCVSALATLSRIPDILSFGSIIVFYCFSLNGTKNKIRSIFVSFISFFLTFLIVITLICGSPTEYVAAWNKAGIISSHENLLGMGISYLNWAYTLLFCFCTLYCSRLFIDKISLKWPHTNQHFKLFITTGLLTTTAFVYLFFNDTSGLSVKCRSFSISFLLFLLYIIGRGKIDNSSKWKTLLAFLLVIFLSAMGSNTGLYKVLCISPIPLALAYTRTTSSERIVSYSVCLALMVFMPINKNRALFFDGGVRDCTSHISGISKLNGIYTTPERADFINRAYNDLTNLKGDVLLTGPKAIFFEYLNESRPPYAAQNFGRNINDNIYVNNTIDYISEKPLSVLVFDDGNESKMSDALMAAGFLCEKKTPDYSIYIRAAQSMAAGLDKE